MFNKKTLCVGLFDKDLNLLLKLLLIKKFGITNVSSVGMDELADREMLPSQSTIEIGTRLRFEICRHSPIHPTIIKEAAEKQLTIINHRPSHINVVERFSTFNLIVTPYAGVYDRLMKREDFNKKRLQLICAPKGIPVTLSVRDAFLQMQSWIEENLYITH